MNFANNIEAMAFDKSGWHRIEILDEGSIVFMGKSLVPDPMPEDNVWLIKKIETLSGKDGSQHIETKYSRPRQSWEDRKNLEYKYFWV